MEDLKVGKILFAYKYEAYGWSSRVPKRLDLEITRETKTMWVLSLNGKEYQKILKCDLSPYGQGHTVGLSKNDKIEKDIKEWEKYIAVKKYIDDVEYGLKEIKGKLPEQYNKLYDFIKQT